MEPMTEMIRVAGRRAVACNLGVVVCSSCKILPEQTNICFLPQTFSPISGGFMGPHCNAVSICWNIVLGTECVTASFLQIVQGLCYHLWFGDREIKQKKIFTCGNQHEWSSNSRKIKAHPLPSFVSSSFMLCCVTTYRDLKIKFFCEKNLGY